MLIFFFGCFKAVPDVVAANHGGVTRHYKFNVYNFTITGQRGTLFWHAHFSWLRVTVYGPLIILPRRNESYPFLKLYKQVSILFGEWFNADPEAVINQSLQTDTFKLKVKPGKTYLLRLINVAVNDELFFGISNHSFTVVEADASYVKPFETDIISMLLVKVLATLILKMTLPSLTLLILLKGTLVSPPVVGLRSVFKQTIPSSLKPTLALNTVLCCRSIHHQDNGGGALQVMRRMKWDEDAEINKKIKAIEEDVKEKEEESKDLEDLNQGLIINECKSDDELQGARE
ncbi:hypothetical protein V6N13_067026 [Hibiscus sabdariffa]